MVQYLSVCMLRIVATSVSILCKDNLTSNDCISLEEDDLVTTCLELCEILQHEFIFAPPCTSLEDAIRSTIAYLRKQNVFLEKVRGFFKLHNDSDPFSFLESLYTYLIILNLLQEANTVKFDWSSCQERLIFLTNLLQPIIHTYYTCACVLKRVVGYEIPEKPLQMDILAEIKSLLQRDLLPFGESLAMETIRNFIKLMVRWDVLDSFKLDRNTSTIIYYIHDHFESESKVEKVIRRIEAFRIHANKW